MKKIIYVIAVIMTLLLLTSCAPEESEFYAQKDTGYIYEINEDILLYSREDGEHIGTLTIMNAVIIDEGDIDVPARGGNFSANAIVQVNYLYDVRDAGDASYNIYSSDFSVTDYTGLPGVNIHEHDIDCDTKYTAYETVFFAVKNVGDYIEITLKNHSHPVATIRAYYNVGEQEVNPNTVKLLGGLLIVLMIVAVVLFICFKKNRKKTAQCEEKLEKIKFEEANVNNQTLLESETVGSAQQEEQFSTDEREESK